MSDKCVPIVTSGWEDSPVGAIERLTFCEFSQRIDCWIRLVERDFSKLDHASAEDVVQKAFIEVMRYIRSVDFYGLCLKHLRNESPATYSEIPDPIRFSLEDVLLTRIWQNGLKTVQKVRRRLSITQPAAGETCPEFNPDHSTDVQDFVAWIDTILTVRQRELCLLLRSGLSQVEIAEMYDVDPSAICKRVKELKKRILRILDFHEYESK